MNDQNRVLNRQGSRELSPDEVEQVGGGFNTLSITCGPNGRDGDGLRGVRSAGVFEPKAKPAGSAV